MDFRFTPEEETFRQELRQFLSSVVTPDLKTETGFEWHAGGVKKRAHTQKVQRQVGPEGAGGHPTAGPLRGQSETLNVDTMLESVSSLISAPLRTM